MTPVAKSSVMIVTCIVVAVCQTFILMGFLRKLKKIESDFWGASARKAEEELERARAEEREKAQQAAEAAASE